MRHVYYVVGMFLAVLIAPGVRAQWNPEALKLAQVMDKVSRFYVDSINDDKVVEEWNEWHLLGLLQ